MPGVGRADRTVSHPVRGTPRFANALPARCAHIQATARREACDAKDCHWGTAALPLRPRMCACMNCPPMAFTATSAATHTDVHPHDDCNRKGSRVSKCGLLIRETPLRRPATLGCLRAVQPSPRTTEDASHTCLTTRLAVEAVAKYVPHCLPRAIGTLWRSTKQG